LGRILGVRRRLRFEINPPNRARGGGPSLGPCCFWSRWRLRILRASRTSAVGRASSLSGRCGAAGSDSLTRGVAAASSRKNVKGNFGDWSPGRSGDDAPRSEAARLALSPALAPRGFAVAIDTIGHQAGQRRRCPAQSSAEMSHLAQFRGLSGWRSSVAMGLRARVLAFTCPSAVTVGLMLQNPRGGSPAPLVRRQTRQNAVLCHSRALAVAEVLWRVRARRTRRASGRSGQKRDTWISCTLLQQR